MLLAPTPPRPARTPAVRLGALTDVCSRHLAGAILCSMAESTAAELLERALSLPTEDRLALGKELLKSIDRQDEQKWADAWLQEVERRAEAAERGDEPLESWEDVEARIVADLHSK